MTRCIVLVLSTFLAMVDLTRTQPLFTDAIPAEEFGARRTRVMEQIGDAFAIVLGAAESPGYVKFRQNHQFFYLTGVEVPRAILLIDGWTKSSTLYLQPRNTELEASEGLVLVPGDMAAKLTGISRVVPREQFAHDIVRLGQERRVVFVPFRPESRNAATSSDHAVAHAAASAADPWDGRPSREAAFMQRLRAHLPQLEIRNLDPFLDAMRLIKSPREVALIRKATQIAGVAMMEVMRSARVGMFEYELAAIGDYLFRRYNAQGPSYYAIVATGANAYYPHYHASQSELKDGELVLYDYAPDYKYYASDVTRMFPANGTFSPRQRELYAVYLQLYGALMESIRPHVTRRDVLRHAVTRMDNVLASTRFSSTKYRDAARRFVDRHRNARARLGHFVGMEVHDVASPDEILRPGMVLTIEPPLRIPEDRVYIRVEDIIVITEDGYENLSAFVPTNPDEIEKLMGEKGMGGEDPLRLGPRAND